MFPAPGAHAGPTIRARRCPRPFGRVGVDERAVAEDPAVHQQAADDAQLDRERVVMCAARRAKVVPELVVGGVDPPAQCIRYQA